MRSYEKGFLIRMKNPKDLVDVIIKLSKDRELRKKMGEEIWLIVEEKFSLSCVNERMLNIFSAMLN